MSGCNAFHPEHAASFIMYSWNLLCTHAIGVPEGVTLLEFEGAIPEEIQEQPGESEEAVNEGGATEELPECPDHRPSTFLKGKPQCMLTLLFYKLILSTFTCLMH
jgi:hypothetical protein